MGDIGFICGGNLRRDETRGGVFVLHWQFRGKGLMKDTVGAVKTLDVLELRVDDE